MLIIIIDHFHLVISLSRRSHQFKPAVKTNPMARRRGPGPGARPGSKPSLQPRIEFWPVPWAEHGG